MTITLNPFGTLASLMLVASLFTSTSTVAAVAQIPLSDVEVRIVQIPHGGCLGPCIKYTVIIRGDGTVEYDGTGLVEGKGLVEGTRRRSISPDEVVSLVNEFLRARFFDALAGYMNRSFIVRDGDTIKLYSSGGSDDPQTDMTLRIGDRRKTVSLYNNYPAELGRLRELVERIGGPQVWQRE